MNGYCTLPSSGRFQLAIYFQKNLSRVVEMLQCGVQEVPIPEWFDPKPTVPFDRVDRFSPREKILANWSGLGAVSSLGHFKISPTK